MLNQSTKIYIFFKFPSLVGMYTYMGALKHVADDLYFYFIRMVVYRHLYG